MPIPIITRPGLQVSRKGVAITPVQITATGSPTSYRAAELPLGLSLAPSTGLISGTPLKLEATVVKIRAGNSSGWSVPVEFEWEVFLTVAEEETKQTNQTAVTERATFAKSVEKANQSSSWAARWR